MGIVSFQPGNKVYHGTTCYEVICTYNSKSIIAKNTETGEQQILLAASVKSTPAERSEDNGGIKSIEHFNTKHWQIALKRLEIIKPLLKDYLTKKEVEDRAQSFAICAGTIYRWINFFKTTGMVSSLVPKYMERGGKGKSRIDEKIESILKTVIENEYLTMQRLRPETLYKDIKRICKIQSLKPPHKNTIINRINALPKREVDKKRYGRQYSDNRFGEKPGHYPAGHYPLDVVQIDHTPLDIHVVDEDYRESLSRRPYLTVAIDVYSRVIVGYYISPDSPSYFSVSQCLTNALLPKDKFLRSLNVEGNWDVWGKPRLINADNAWEFRGSDLTQVCMEEYTIILEWRPVKKPEYGGHIERLCGTLNKKIHELPGTTFSNIKERGDVYDSEAEAVMTIEELERWFTDLVINDYHKNIHSGIEMSPIQKYEIGICGSDSTVGTGLPSAIDDEERLRISLYPHFKRTVQRDGIVIEGIHYYHDILRKWIGSMDGKSKKLFIVKYNPRDMSMVFFFDPELKLYFPIPYRNMSNKPISLWQWRAARKFLKKQGRKNYDEVEIFLAAERRSRMVENATLKTKSARREKSAARFHARKLRDEKHSVEKSRDKGTKISSTVQVKLSNINDLFTDVKPFDGIKVLQKKSDRS